MTTSYDLNEYKFELYSRGYIIRADRPPVAPDGWCRSEFCGYHVAHDPRLAMHKNRLADCEVMALGTIFDVRRPNEGMEDCVAGLTEELAKSEAHLLEHLGYTCGRYILAYRRKDGSSFVVPDATGMKTIFYYHGTPKMIGSHHNLLLDNAPEERLRKQIPMKFGYPGLRAPLEKTFLLTPNTRLNMRDLTVSRFWPTSPIEERSLALATKIVRRNMQGAVDYIVKHHRPIISLTAGLDSRLTLSFFRTIPGAEYFTYYRSDNVDTDFHDCAFAQWFQKEIGRDVTVLELRKDPKIHPDFLDILNHNTYFSHIKNAAWSYYHRYSGIENLVHVRSNISEVGREFWRQKKFEVKSGKDLARVYLHGGKEYKASYIFNVIEHFEEFDEITGLTKCGELVDLKSLFYWEFRMASWHSQVVVESDPAFETFSIFNCRRTLEAMLSVPLQDRLDSMILRQIIASNWPALSRYDVNGQPFWPSGREGGGV